VPLKIRVSAVRIRLEPLPGLPGITSRRRPENDKKRSAKSAPNRHDDMRNFPMKKSTLPLLVLPLLFLFGSIAPLAAEPGGFRFPGGEVDDGREAFIALNCLQCHTVAKTELPDPKSQRRIELNLAGQVRFVKRYEDLVIAITNPRHVVTEQYRAILTGAEASGGIEPVMPDLTKDMSARQLMDLTAFLDAAYRAGQESYGK